MNSTAREARNAALERHRLELKSAKDEYVANVKVWASVALAAGVAIGYLLFGTPENSMGLPEPDQIVVAYTHDQTYVAYLDSSWEFRSYADGLPIGQVISWEDQ